MRSFVIFVLAMAPAIVCVAGPTPDVTVFGGFRGGGELFAKNIDFIDTNLDVDGTSTYGFSLGVPVSSRWRLELTVGLVVSF